MHNQTPCPCSSGKPYQACCGPFIAGDAPAATAEELMRSRYTAYVLREVNYLLATWHPSTRPAAIDPETIPAWQGLRIVHTNAGGKGDLNGMVEFIATATDRGTTLRLHEASRFVREDGGWLYIDGEIKEDPAAKQPAKPGRNAPCPCGSGKKFKKCCGP